MLELVILAVSPLLNTLHRSVLHSVVMVSGMLRLCTCSTTSGDCDTHFKLVLSDNLSTIAQADKQLFTCTLARTKSNGFVMKLVVHPEIQFDVNTMFRLVFLCLYSDLT